MMSAIEAIPDVLGHFLSPSYRTFMDGIARYLSTEECESNAKH